MKKTKDTLRGFFLGVLLTALVASIPMVSATVAKRSIDVVYNDIKLVVDGREVTPLDGAGKVVEPFIYNGTTYLPLRAAVNAITGGTKPVDWDQATHTIYIGDRPALAPVDMATLKRYPQGTDAFWTNSTFSVRQKNYTPFNTYICNIRSTFLLAGNYTTLNGFLAAPDNGDPDRYYAVKFINEDTGKELLKVEVKHGNEPVPVSLDLTGVDKLTIQNSTPAMLFNVTLTPIPVG